MMHRLSSKLLIAILLLAFAGVVFLSGCSSSDDEKDDITTPSVTTPEDLIGVWAEQVNISQGVAEFLSGELTLAIGDSSDFAWYLHGVEQSSGSVELVDNLLTLHTEAAIDQDLVGTSAEYTVTVHSSWMSFDYSVENVAQHLVFASDVTGTTAVLGCVRTAEGSEVLTNVSVTLGLSSGGSLTETTDQYGLFYRGSVPAGDMDVTASKEGYLDYTTSVSVSENTTSFVECEMIVDEGGSGNTLEALAGTWCEWTVSADGNLMVLDGTTHLILDAAGTFQWIVQGGEYSSGTATLEGNTLTLLVQASQNPDQIGTSTVTTITADSSWMCFDYVVESTSLHVLLTRDYSGKNALVGVAYAAETMSTIAGATVTLQYEVGDPVLLTTDQFGQFFYDAATTGSVDVTVSKEGYQDKNESVTLSANTTLFTGFPLIVDNGGNGTSITGTIIDMHTGMPIEGAFVNTVEGDQGPNVVFTDNNGQFSISVDPGTVSLYFGKASYRQIWNQYEITEGETLAITVRLGLEASMDGCILGRVTDANTGVNIRQASVAINGENVTLTNLAGQFITTRTAGVYTVSISKTGYQTMTRDFVYVDAGLTTELVFELVPAR